MTITLASRARRAVQVAGLALVLGISGAAWADADGPDAWQVTGLSPNEPLDARMGPGYDYPVLGQFAPHARGLRQVTCVPYLTFEMYQNMSAQERLALGQRWCLMQSSDFTLSGWVPQAFLAEDGGQ